MQAIKSGLAAFGKGLETLRSSFQLMESYEKSAKGSSAKAQDFNKVLDNTYEMANILAKAQKSGGSLSKEDKERGSTLLHEIADINKQSVVSKTATTVREPKDASLMTQLAQTPAVTATKEAHEKEVKWDTLIAGLKNLGEPKKGFFSVVSDALKVVKEYITSKNSADEGKKACSQVLNSCSQYWQKNGDEKTKQTLVEAMNKLDKIFHEPSRSDSKVVAPTQGNKDVAAELARRNEPKDPTKAAGEALLKSGVSEEGKSGQGKQSPVPSNTPSAAKTGPEFPARL